MTKNRFYLEFRILIIEAYLLFGACPPAGRGFGASRYLGSMPYALTTSAALPRPK